MMIHNRLDLVNFIEIINYMSRETDPAPWSKVIYIIEMYEKYIHLPEGAAILKVKYIIAYHGIIETIKLFDLIYLMKKSKIFVFSDSM